MKVTYKDEGVGIFDKMVDVIGDDGKEVLGQKRSYKRGVMFHNIAFPTNKAVDVDENTPLGQALLKNAANRGSPFSIDGAKLRPVKKDVPKKEEAKVEVEEAKTSETTEPVKGGETEKTPETVEPKKDKGSK